MMDETAIYTEFEKHSKLIDENAKKMEANNRKY